jgi:hypothetical protein
MTITPQYHSESSKIIQRRSVQSEMVDSKYRQHFLQVPPAGDAGEAGVGGGARGPDRPAFGIEVDEERNRGMIGGGEISTDSSLVRVLVVPANEEAIIARDTVAVVSKAVVGAAKSAGELVSAQAIARPHSNLSAELPK